MKERVRRRVLTVLIMPALLATAGCDRFFDVDHAQQAEAAFAAGNYSEARIHYINQLKQKQGDPQISMRLARTLIELGDGIGALTVLEKFVDHSEVGLEAKALSAKALVIEERYDQVLEATQDLSGSHMASLAWSRASALYLLGREAEAASVLEQGLEQAPDDLELNLLKGSALLADGKQREARALSAQLMERHDGDPLALIFAGQLARLDGDEAQAQKLLEQAAAKRPQHAQLLRELGDSYRQSENTDKAREYYQRSLDIAPGNPHALLALAELEFFEGNQQVALDILQSEERLIRSIPEGLRLSGLIAEKRGNHASAQAKLKRYLRDNPNDAIALAALARVYDATSQPALALQARQKAEQFEGQAPAQAGRPADPAARASFDMAEKAIAAGDWQQADRLYAELIVNPDMRNPMVFNNAAMVKLELGNRADALALAERAYSLAPNNPFVQDSLGWILFLNARQPDRAAKLLTDAYDANPNNLEISWHLAQVLATAGRRKDAIAIMERLKSGATPAHSAQIDALIARL